MEKLKPCPFCGAPAKRFVFPAGEHFTERDYKVSAYCSRPECGANITFINQAPSWVKDPAQQAKETIHKAWNKRTLL